MGESVVARWISYFLSVCVRGYNLCIFCFLFCFLHQKILLSSKASCYNTTSLSSSSTSSLFSWFVFLFTTHYYYWRKMRKTKQTSSLHSFSYLGSYLSSFLYTYFNTSFIFLYFLGGCVKKTLLLDKHIFCFHMALSLKKCEETTTHQKTFFCAKER